MENIKVDNIIVVKPEIENMNYYSYNDVALNTHLDYDGLMKCIFGRIYKIIEVNRYDVMVKSNILEYEYWYIDNLLIEKIVTKEKNPEYFL